MYTDEKLGKSKILISKPDYWEGRINQGYPCKSANMYLHCGIGSYVPKSTLTIPTFVVRTRNVYTISSHFLNYVIIKFVNGNGLLYASPTLS